MFSGVTPLIKNILRASDASGAHAHGNPDQQPSFNGERNFKEDDGYITPDDLTEVSIDSLITYLEHKADNPKEQHAATALSSAPVASNISPEQAARIYASHIPADALLFPQRPPMTEEYGTADLLLRLKDLKAAGLTTLVIERADSFIASIENAVAKAPTP